MFSSVAPFLSSNKDLYESAVLKIPIGIVSQVTLKTPSDRSILEAHMVTETCKSLERIEVLMRI